MRALLLFVYYYGTLAQLRHIRCEYAKLIPTSNIMVRNDILSTSINVVIIQDIQNFTIYEYLRV